MERATTWLRFFRSTSGGMIKAMPGSHIMKIPLLKAVFTCAVAFTCVFSYAVSASAHGKHADASKETVTAGKAGTSRSALREFVLHAKAHWEVPVPRERSLQFWQQTGVVVFVPVAVFITAIFGVPGASQTDEAVTRRDVLVTAIDLDRSLDQHQRDSDVFEVAVRH